MTIEPFQPIHIDILKAQGVQGSQVQEVSHVPASCASVQRPLGPAVTARAGGKILLCGGVVTIGSYMGIGWAVLSKDAWLYMTPLHYATKRFLDASGLRRIEATVEEGFTEGCRWMRLLGFKFEGNMPGYGTKGETHLRFGRVWPSSLQS